MICAYMCYLKISINFVLYVNCVYMTSFDIC